MVGFVFRLPSSVLLFFPQELFQKLHFNRAQTIGRCSSVQSARKGHHNSALCLGCDDQMALLFFYDLVINLSLRAADVRFSYVFMSLTTPFSPPASVRSGCVNRDSSVATHPAAKYLVIFCVCAASYSAKVRSAEIRA